MGKAGLTLATILVAGTITCLGLSSNYVANAEKYQQRFVEEYSNTKQEELAFFYGEISNSLEYVADNLGNYVLKDDKVVILEKPEKKEVPKYIDDSIAKILSSQKHASYENKEQISELYEKVNGLEKKFLSLDLNYLDENAKKLQDLKNEAAFLSTELENKAIVTNPNYLSLEYKYDEFDSNKDSLIMAIVFSSFGVIGFGIWMAIEASEVSNDLSYYRNDNKRRKTRI